MPDSPDNARGMLLPGAFSLRDLRYKIFLAEDFSRANITCCLKLETSSPRILFASLAVDGHELLPSARIPIHAGVDQYSLRHVSIIRPNLWWTHGQGLPSLYQMRLSLSEDAAHSLQNIQEIGIRRLCSKRKGGSTERIIELNGRALSANSGLLVLPPGAPASLNLKITDLLNSAREAGINLLFSIDPISEDLLCACDREGILLMSKRSSVERALRSKCMRHPSAFFMKCGKDKNAGQCSASMLKPGIYPMPGVPSDALPDGEFLASLVGKALLELPPEA